MRNNDALSLNFIETYLREGADSDKFSDMKKQLYQRGYNRNQVVELIVAGSLYGNLDNFYRRHPNMR